MPVGRLSPGNEPMLPGRLRCSGVGFLGWRPRLKHLGKGFLTAPGSEAGVGHGGEGEAVAAGGGLQQQGWYRLSQAFQCSPTFYLLSQSCPRSKERAAEAVAPYSLLSAPAPPCPCLGPSLAAH